MSWKAKAISSTETCRHPTWLLEHVKAGLNPLMSHLSYSPESLNDVEDVSGRRLIVTYDFEILWGCWGSEFKVFQRVSIHFLWHVAAMWIGLMTSTGWWSLVCFPKLDDGNTGNLSEVNPIKHPELGWLIIDFTTTWARKRDVPVIRSN
jgi:hypothetical protein